MFLEIASVFSTSEWNKTCCYNKNILRKNSYVHPQCLKKEPEV